MNLAKLTVPRPVATSMFFLCIILLGVVSFRRLPVDLMPDVTFPRLTISAEYEGVGPEEIEQLITRPIERAVASIDGVEEISSVSGEERSQVRVAFTWGTSLDVAAQDVRTALDRIKDVLPEDATTPRVFKFDFSAFPIVFLGVASDLDLSALSQFLEDRVKYRIERLPGVAAADVRGARTREVQVRLDLNRMQARRVTPEQVMAAISGENLNAPAGSVREGSREILVRTEGEYASLQEIADTVVVERAGASVRVRDVGEVSASLEEERYIVRINAKPGVIMFVRKQSGANTVDVASVVMKEIAKLNEEYPQIQITPIVDTSRFIKNSIEHVENEALVGAILATGILLIFLNSVASVLVVAIAIPLSVIATFVLIYFSGFTLNVMTFGGLALGVGLLVDNSIVVLENIYRRLEIGDRPYKAAINGAAEVSDAITASTMTTIAVFLPLIFFTGLAGVLFRQLAAVVSFSLICSLIAAAALVPTLCGQLFKRQGNEAREDGRHFHSGWIREYEKALSFSLQHPYLVMFVFILCFVGAVSLVPALEFELMPSVDEGTIRISLEAQVGTHIDAMHRLLLRLEGICRDEAKETETFFSRVGTSGYRVRGGNEGQVRLTLVPKGERKRSSDEVAKALRERTKDMPGMTLRIRSDSGTFMRRLSGGAGERLSVEVRGFDLDTAAGLAKKVGQAIEDVDGITDVRISREDGRPELICRIDRAKAASHGLSFRRVSEMLNTLVAGSTASQFREKGDEYRIFVRLDEPFRDFAKKLGSYSIITADGQRVFLRSLLSFSRQKGPLTIERQDQQRIVTIQAHFQGRDLGSIAKDIRAKMKGIAVPKGFEIHMGGEVEEQEEAYHELIIGLILSIVLVYMVMAAQFESFSAPFVIMFTMPMGVIGVVVALVLTHTPISINAIMGLIMLAGIVVNDAIVLVDAIIKIGKDKRESGTDAVIIEAGKRRLRPVLMTTFTTTLALVPIAIGLGEGAEIQAPMARVVIGGLLSATFITLVVVPLVYRTVNKFVVFVLGPPVLEEE